MMIFWQVWGIWDIRSRAPSVAVDVLSLLHVLVEDEHMIMKGKGGGGGGGELGSGTGHGSARFGGWVPTEEAYLPGQGNWRAGFFCQVCFDFKGFKSTFAWPTDVAFMIHVGKHLAHSDWLKYNEGPCTVAAFCRFSLAT